VRTLDGNDVLVVYGLEGQGPLGGRSLAQLVEGFALVGVLSGFLDDLFEVGLGLGLGLGLVDLGPLADLGLLVVDLSDDLARVNLGGNSWSHRDKKVVVWELEVRRWLLVVRSNSRLWMMEGRKKIGALYMVDISVNAVYLNCH
jgi:hypothetical protein